MRASRPVLSLVLPVLVGAVVSGETLAIGDADILPVFTGGETVHPPRQVGLGTTLIALGEVLELELALGLPLPAGGLSPEKTVTQLSPVIPIPICFIFGLSIFRLWPGEFFQRFMASAAVFAPFNLFSAELFILTPQSA